MLLLKGLGSWRVQHAVLGHRTRSMALSVAGTESGAAQSAEVPAQRIVQQAIAWCGLNSLMYTDGKLNWSHAPVTLCPSPYPAVWFEYLRQIQPMINVLIDNIARDREFLTSCLAPVAEADPFVRRLLDMYLAVPETTIRTGTNLGILRSDYMLNDDDSRNLASPSDEPPLQIEMNTIASSFGCLSQKVGDLHRHLLNRYADADDMKKILQVANLGESDTSHHAHIADYIPENPSIRLLALSIATAHFLHFSLEDASAAVLFVVQPGERNVADQRLLEAELWDSHRVRVEFMTLAQVATRGRLGYGNLLLVRPDESSQAEVRVSVAYFRAGYRPEDYPSEAEWRARHMVEESLCIKCPTLGYQLAGTKKVQQALCAEGIMERFVASDMAGSIRRCFAAQYSLGASATPASLRAIDEAIRDGSEWVLKPQREGGGNNLYGAELSAFLRTHANDAVLDSYILMQRIFPRPQKAAFLRGGRLDLLPCVSELGIYGTFLGDGVGKPILNDFAGYLLRTKPVGVDEGGVATGYSVLSSVALTDTI